jgi:hypothetical protein
MNAFTFQVSSTSTCQWAAGDHVSLVRLEWVASWLAQPLTLPRHPAKDLSCQYQVWCRFHLPQLDLRSTLWLGCWGLVFLCDGSDADYLACFLNPVLPYCEPFTFLCATCPSVFALAEVDQSSHKMPPPLPKRSLLFLRKLRMKF